MRGGKIVLIHLLIRLHASHERAAENQDALSPHRALLGFARTLFRIGRGRLGVLGFRLFSYGCCRTTAAATASRGAIGTWGVRMIFGFAIARGFGESFELGLGFRIDPFLAIRIT